MASAEEGVPPAGADQIRSLKPSERRKRAAAAGATEEEIEACDDAADPIGAYVELILKKADKLPADPISEPEPEPDRDLNIKQLLGQHEPPWKQHDYYDQSKWWLKEAADQVNRLRAAARIRDSLPDSRRDIPDLYPQLVVLGDGNTGKSTVLNRFAEFSFSAVSDGVCTRRPVRLELRPVAAHRERSEGILAFCTMFDKQYRDGVDEQYSKEFTLRAAHREEDEGALRREVESRAAEKPGGGDSQSDFDRQYIDEELVIRIEADQMIYFDLLDLPGLDNTSRKPHHLVEKYVNAQTLPRTFVLIFSEHKKGDTQLMHSLAQAVLKTTQEQVQAQVRRFDMRAGASAYGGQAAFRGFGGFGEAARAVPKQTESDAAAWRRFQKERCLGVLTKVDKELEDNQQDARSYNRDAAEKLKKSLLCVDHPKHLDTWEWVAVLNPTSFEQAKVSAATE